MQSSGVQTVDDKLGRYKLAKKITMMIFDDAFENTKNGHNYSSVIALNGKWGYGKTTLIDYISHIFNNERKMKEFDPQRKYLLIKYDAWVNDGYKDALIPIVYNVLMVYKDDRDFVEKTRVYIREKVKKIKERKKVHGLLSALNELKIIYSIASVIDDLPVLKEVTRLLSDQHKNPMLSDYDDFLEVQRLLDKVFSDLNCNDKIVFIIDELDRCKPNFAIETLEAIKHYFNYSNFIFLFAVNLYELKETVKHVYGLNTNANGYLDRFFDYKLDLPRTDHRRNDFSAHSISELLTNSKVEFNATFFSNMCSELNLSLRDVQYIVLNYNLLEIDDYFNHFQFSCNLIFMLFLKNNDKELYERIVYNQDPYNYQTEYPIALLKTKYNLTKLFKVEPLFAKFIDSLTYSYLMMDDIETPKHSSAERVNDMLGEGFPESKGPMTYGEYVADLISFG